MRRRHSLDALSFGSVSELVWEHLANFLFFVCELFRNMLGNSLGTFEDFSGTYSELFRNLLGNFWDTFLGLFFFVSDLFETVSEPFSHFFNTFSELVKAQQQVINFLRLHYLFRVPFKQS